MYGWRLINPLGKGRRTDGKPYRWDALKPFRLSVEGLGELLRNPSIQKGKTYLSQWGYLSAW